MINYKRNIRFFQKPYPISKQIISCSVYVVVFILVLCFLSKINAFLLFLNHSLINEKYIKLVVPLIALGIFLKILYLALFCYFKRFYNIPKAEEIDFIFQQQCDKTKECALKKININPDSIINTPLLISEYNFAQNGKREINDNNLSCCGDRVDQEIWRSPVIESYIFILCEETIHYYRRVESIISKNVHEETGDFFYKDIKSVKIIGVSEMRLDWLSEQEYEVYYDRFIINSADGTTISCAVESADSQSIMGQLRSFIRNKIGKKL